MQFIFTLKNTLVEELPDSFGQLTRLGSLQIMNTPLKKLPDTIGGLTNVGYLLLQSTLITEFPESIANMSNLIFIDACDNQLIKLTESLADLPKIENIYVAGNHLTEEIPERLLDKFSISNRSQLIINDQTSHQSLNLTYASEITYEQLTSPLILQAKAKNNGILAGNWQITQPNGKKVTVSGNDGSEMIPALFSNPGHYQINFQWTANAPFENNRYPHRNINLQSLVDLTIEEAEENSHQVTLILRYLDQLQPEQTFTYTIPDGGTFHENFEILDGYALQNSRLRIQPAFEVDMSPKTVTLSPVHQDHVIKLEFDRKEYRIDLTMKYLDNLLPETTNTYWSFHRDNCIQTYEIADGYQITNISQLPSNVMVDQGNNTITIFRVTQSYDIVLELKKQLPIIITIIYEDDSFDNQVMTYQALDGDSFQTKFNIRRGYSISRVNFNGSGISVNNSRQTISIERVTDPVNITIRVSK